jgi:hypothetical protein
LANLVIDGEGADVNFDNRIGLVAGGFVTWPMTPRFDIQPEALVSLKGASFDERFPSSSGTARRSPRARRSSCSPQPQCGPGRRRQGQEPGVFSFDRIPLLSHEE